jgi:hypothetical protein
MMLEDSVGIVRSLAFAVGLALAACGAAAPAQTQTLSPLSSSDQIRQSRPVAEVEALVFDLRREVTADGKPTETTDEAYDNVYRLHGGGVPEPLTPERSRRVAGAQFLGKVIGDIWDSQAPRVGDT